MNLQRCAGKEGPNRKKAKRMWVYGSQQRKLCQEESGLHCKMFGNLNKLKVEMFVSSI